MVGKSHKSSPYFFRRIWSPFGHSIQAIRNTAGIALGAVDSAGKSVTGHLNDAVGNLVRPRRGGRRTRKASRKAMRRTRRKASRKVRKSRKHMRKH
jgi:hypothetical protein